MGREYVRVWRIQFKREMELEIEGIHMD